MRKILFLTAVFCGIAASAKTIDPLSIAPISTVVNNILSEPSPKEIKSLKLKDVQKLAGRKLTLKEKIAFLLIKKKLRKTEENGSSGQTAFIIGIIGLALLIAGLFIPYVILGALVAGIIAIVMGNIAKKNNPSDVKAKMGVLMGWITLGAIAFLFLLAAIVLASWSWG